MTQSLHAVNTAIIKIMNTTFGLGFKYAGQFSPFLSVSRNSKGLVIVENGLLWKNCEYIDDIHMSYPVDGNVHHTVNKQGSFRLHVYHNRTDITCYTASHVPQSLQDFSAAALLSLPLKLFAKRCDPIDLFDADGFFAFPTSAFVVEKASTARFFRDDPLKIKYQLIDLNSMEGNIINVHLFLIGKNKVESYTYQGPHEVIFSDTFSSDPSLSIIVTSSPNQSQ
jgi:hypothetical protein